MINEVGRRNTLALEQSLKNLTERSYEQQERIDGLVATIGTMVERLNSMERVLMHQRAAAAGHGPTVKSNGL